MWVLTPQDWCRCCLGISLCKSNPSPPFSTSGSCCSDVVKYMEPLSVRLLLVIALTVLLLTGLVPAGIRLIPHTVLTFIFLEQLRTCCGIRIVT
ncbi:unnamed protein product [Coregonus sp. 'balchen']|nr:unnamed protein product [Coregonus sp. 'balchen']